ncbi:MAG TPA: hypothetical protein VGH38_28975 [Bryobacteraceae bacterium]|jgi:hypothetical protein
MLLPNSRGGYSFLKGIGPYSAGVVAARGFAIEHVRLAQAIRWKAGFELVETHLRTVGRPRQALCAMALRSPKPFSFEGFNEFNAGYVDVLKAWEIPVEGVNPVARTNVAPAVDPPDEPSLYSFAYTVTASSAPISFVVAGAGELPEGSLDPHDVVRRGETSRNALAVKTRFVLGLMEGRLKGLGATWNDVAVTDIYTVHDLNALLAAEILPRIGPAARHGVTWHYTRPPIVTIEYEMDLRGGTRESVIPV